jgi:hypothetical protein
MPLFNFPEADDDEEEDWCEEYDLEEMDDLLDDEDEG